MNYYEALGKAYHAKESFFEIWDNSSQKVGLFTRYKVWESKLPVEIHYACNPLLKAVQNWRNVIFSYFDHPITNAYTESINSLIRVMNRLGRGYSFEALRAKVLFTEGLHKKKTPIYRKSDIYDHQLRDIPPDFLHMTSINHKILNFDIDIEMLMKKLQEEKL